jgi:hypothetical protein
VPTTVDMTSAAHPKPAAAATTDAGPWLAGLADRHGRKVARALADAQHRHNGIHRARKSLRSQRAILALLKPVLDETERKRLARIDAQLKRLLKRLSRLRDAHVAVLAAQAMATPAPASLQRKLVTALTRQRDRLTKQALQDDPAFAARRSTVKSIRTELATLPWPRLDAHAARRAAKRQQRRVERAEHLAHHAPSAEHRHGWRRRLRRLRLQLEALEQAAGAGVAIDLHKLPGSHALKRQTDRIGHLQDVQLLCRLARRTDAVREDVALRTLLAAEMRAARAEHAHNG